MTQATARTAAGEAVPAAIAETFMCRLFDPLPDAELADPEMEKLEKRVERQKRKAAKDRWRTGMFLVQRANHLHQAVGLKIAYRVWSTSTCYTRTAEEKEDEDTSLRVLCMAINKQYEIPAPDAKAVAWKRKWLGMAVFGAPVEEITRRKEMLAADEARLGISPRD